MPDQPAMFRFSLNEVPKPRRLEVATEVMGRTLMNMDFSMSTDDPQIELEFRFLPGVTVTQGWLTAHRSDTGYDPSRDSDDFALIWASRPARGWIEQIGRNQQSDGSSVLMSCAERTTCETAEAFPHTVLKLQRSLLLPLLPDAEDALMRVIPRDNQALRLLDSYCAGLRALGDAPASSRLARMAATHITDLVALAVGTNRDAAHVASQRGLRAARLAAIKRWALARLDSPALNVNAAAAAQGISPRSVQLLFESEGATFNGYVMRERLALARQRLSQPRARSITDIAYDCGFGDLSYFTRSFRRAYGQTPSDARREAQASQRDPGLTNHDDK